MTDTNYLSLYRKYSPKNFDELVGQELVKKYFINSISNDTLSHAYIFEGPSGVGKTSTCKIFSYTVNCLNLNEKHQPCYECDSCLAIKNKIGDLKSIDGATNRGIDTIKALQENLIWPPRFKKRIIVIDEAHMLTDAAWNSLLSTIEDPPENIIFIFATTDCKKIPKTISTRCQTFHFHPIDNHTMLTKLKEICIDENIEFDSLETIKKLIEHSNGSLRMAQGLLEQSINTSSKYKKLSIENVNNILFSNSENLSMEIYNLILKNNESDLCIFFNNINYNITEDIFFDIIKLIRYDITNKTTSSDIYEVLVKCIEIFIEFKNKLSYNSNAKTILEVCCLKCIMIIKEFLNKENNSKDSFVNYLDRSNKNNEIHNFITINKISLFLSIIDSINVSLNKLLLQSELELINNGKILNIKLDNNSNNVEIITEALKSSRGQKIKAIIDVNNFSINNNLY